MARRLSSLRPDAFVEVRIPHGPGPNHVDAGETKG